MARPVRAARLVRHVLAGLFFWGGAACIPLDARLWWGVVSTGPINGGYVMTTVKPTVLYQALADLARSVANIENAVDYIQSQH